MPNMFSRRRGSSANPPIDRDTRAAAAAAAGQAFLASSQSNASLASAAAGAALRSRTTTPEPVGSIQTKRMVRRGSNSSVGSGSVIGSGTRGGVGRGGLQRQNSGGSMTERTFRSPSPGPRSNGAMSPAPDAPPVPAIPRNIPSGHKRANSLEPPQRVLSPTPRGGGRGVSVDRGGGSSSTGANRLSKRLSNVFEGEEAERQNNNNVNFSRPMSPSASPVTPRAAAGGGGAKKYTHGTGSWFSQAGGAGEPAKARPKTSDGVPAQRAAAGFAGQEVINAANRPVAKKRPASGVNQGSHLAQANNEPTSVAYDAEDYVMVYDPNTRTFTAKLRDKPKEVAPPVPKLPEPEPLAPGTYDPHTRKIVPGKAMSIPSATSLNSADTDAPSKKKPRPVLSPVETKLEPPPRNPARLSPSASPTSPRAAGHLHKQPSVVREDPEGEEEASAAYSKTPLANALKPTGRTIQTSAGPAKAYVTPTHQRSTSLDIPRGGSADGRGRGGSLNSSHSPARSAHFSASPVIEAIRHDPPPRSISPVKSAMKHSSHSPSSSVRTASPMQGRNFSPLPGAAAKAGGGGTSDAMSDAGESVASSQDGGVGMLSTGVAKKEKKRARVSFEEQPKDIDESGAVATPKAIATASPYSSIARDRSPAALADHELEAEMMKPRPALPSFGSVRRNRPLSPEVAEKVTEMPPERGASSDQALAGILVNHAAGGKKEQDAPLPPEVTSKETAPGYGSEGSEDEQQPSAMQAGDAGAPKTRDFAAEAARKTGEPEHAKPAADVPAINLLPPTPGEEVGKQIGNEEPAGQSPRPKASFEYNIPGGWATEEESSEDKNVAALPSSSAPPAPITTPAVVSSAPEPKTLIDDADAFDKRPSPILSAVDEESDDSAAFSDAAEDLSDLDEGGFASLDALVTSPISPSSPTTADKGKARAPAEEAEVGGEDSPTTRPAAKKALAQHGIQSSGDWSDVTAHWSRLSRQQKEQIEREHLSSDDEARPSPVVAAKKQQVKKKKSAMKQPMTQEPVQQERKEHSMPKTMRAAAPAAAPPPRSGSVGSAGGDGEVHMRRSMRSSGNTAGGPTEMRSTMRSGRASPQPAQRPQSEVVGGPGRQNRNGNMQPRPMSAAGGPQASSQLAASGLPARPRTARAGSDASDNVAGSQDSAFPRMMGQQQAKRQQPAAARQAQSGPAAGRTTPIAPGGAFTAKLQKQVSNKDDSDSESSFKKKRRASAATMDSTGRYNMRRSMRTGSVGQASVVDMRPSSPTPAMPAKRGGGAFSIRSLSPSGGSVFGRGRGEKLRESLRSGSVDAAPGKRTTLRQNAPAPTMRGPGGGGGRPSTARAAAAPTTPAKPRFKSRFMSDSDDEDERRGKPSFFRSRFADSDDEEPSSPGVIAADLRPVRGIPRRAGRDDGDSTDLEDEEDERPGGGKGGSAIVADPAAVEKAMEAARRKLGIPAVAADSAAGAAPAESKQGAALGQGSMRKPAEGEAQSPKPEEPQTNGVPAEKKRRGFMGSILRRNRNSTQSVMTLGGSPAPASPAAPASPQAQKVAGESSIPSSPSQGKLVRRGSQQPQPKPKVKRGDSTFSTTSNATAPTMSSTHLAQAQGDKDSENWPLPPVPKIPAAAGDSADNRPNTSDGVSSEAIKLARTMRPDIGQRSQSGQPLGSGQRVGFAEGSKDGDAAEGSGTYRRRTGKKKKFGMLRRAFGLND